MNVVLDLSQDLQQVRLKVREVRIALGPHVLTNLVEAGCSPERNDKAPLHMATHAAERKGLEIATDVDFAKEEEVSKLVRPANLEAQNRPETCPQNFQELDRGAQVVAKKVRYRLLIP